MNKIYTQQDINQFFNQLKELQNSYELEKVHHLINNPNARARQLVNLNHKPLKTIIMTSAFIAGTAALMLWLIPDKTIEVINQHVLKPQDRNQISISLAKKERIFPQEATLKAKNENDQNKKVKQFPGFSTTTEVFKNNSESQWPADTVIDFDKIISLKRQNQNIDVMDFKARNITDGLHLIELSEPELQKLGLVFGDSSISYNNRLFELNIFKTGQGITMRKENSILECIARDILYKDTSTSKESQYKPINLVYLSDEFGEQNIKWITDLDDEDKNTPEYFLKKSQLLIPILLRKSDYPNLMSQNQIFWFEPSSALFDSLPESIGHQLALEYNYITAAKNEKLHLPASTCVYFEACKSTLDIDDFKLYPNPAQLNATIDFTLSKSTSGWISLVSISGSQLKFLVPATTFAEGINSIIIDISDILPGIYLVLLSTDEGFITQRLIISR